MAKGPKSFTGCSHLGEKVKKEEGAKEKEKMQIKELSELNIFLDECIHPSFDKYTLCSILKSELLYKYKAGKIVKMFTYQALKSVFRVEKKKKWIYIKLRSHGFVTRVKRCSLELLARHMKRT